MKDSLAEFSEQYEKELTIKREIEKKSKNKN